MRPRRKSATRATFASCRHPGIFIERVCFFKAELESRYRLTMKALMARKNTRLPAMMAKNSLSKRSTPEAHTSGGD
jgi:hypothetical protein